MHRTGGVMTSKTECDFTVFLLTGCMFVYVNPFSLSALGTVAPPPTPDTVSIHNKAANGHRSILTMTQPAKILV